MSMTTTEAPRSIRQDISIQQIGTETLLYDARRHMAYCLNESSSAIWNLADGEHTIAGLATAASLRLGFEVSEDFVQFALTQLRGDGLVESSPTVAGLRPTITRRAMLQKLGVGGAMLLPAIAAIVAPTAAQAYSGCFNCSTSSPSRAARARRQPLSGTGPKSIAPSTPQ
jgi:hypothetical protein